SIVVQITPRTETSVGEPITSPSIVVKNGLHRVSDVKFLSSVYPDNKDIVLTWIFKDFEIQQIGDIDETAQFDQTNVKWYSRNPGEIDFTLVYSYNDIDNSLQEVFFVEEYRGNIATVINPNSTNSIISKNILFKGKEFYAVITPYDTIDKGPEIISSTITITSSIN
ncbi:unnamed protein product, partial [marine sediment metagenome]